MNLRSEFAAGQPLKRFAFTLQLRDGAVEVCNQPHRDLWPEMRNMLKRAGISDYAIYRQGNLLSLTFKAADFENTWSKFDDGPINMRWQKATAPFFAPVEIRRGERFPMKEEIFFFP
jgi:L-rhamnose mutarotase